MAFINNPLGAMGASQLVLPDLTKQVESLQRTEIERELQEIKQNKAWEREDALRNQKLALDFAAPETFDTLRQSQVEGFLNRKKAYEEKAAKFFGSGLPATSADYTKGLVELQRDKQALINETMREKAFADAYSDLQAKFPAMYKSLETQEQKDKFNKQIADFVLKLKDPKQKPEVYDMIQAFTAPEPPAAYDLSKVSKELVPLVDKAIMRDANGRTKVDEEAALRTINANLTPNTYLFNKGVEEGLWSTQDEMNRQVLDRVYTSIGINPVGWKPSSGGSGGGGVDKNARDYTPSPYEYGKNKYNMVQIPSDVSQVDRNFFINKAKNLDTGETVQLDQNKASLLGVDVDKGVVILKGTGGFAMKDGKPLFIKEGSITPPKIDGEYNADTMATLSNSTRQETILKGAYTGDRPVEGFKNVSLEENEDGITLKGTVVVDKKLPFTGSSEVPVEVRYTKFKDPKAEAVFEAPLNENKPAVAIMFPKVKVRGVPLEQYVDKPSSKSQGYSPQEEAGISRVMEKNGVSREEAIRALVAAKKLKQ